FVNTAPVIDPLAPGYEAIIGDIFSLKLSATDADGDSLTFSVSDNPPHSGIVNNNTFYWWPKFSGTYNSSYNTTITVSDGKDTDDLQVSLYLQIVDSDSAVTYQKNDLTGFTDIGGGKAPNWATDPTLSAADTFDWGYQYSSRFAAIKFWDLDIPANARIDSATLLLTKLYDENWTNDDYAQIYSSLKDIDIDDFSWDYYDKSASLSWDTPGAKSTGSDYTVEGKDSVGVIIWPHYIRFLTFDVTELVKASFGIDSVRPNYGWIIKGNPSVSNRVVFHGLDKNFDSPKLKVYYSYTEAEKIVVAKDGNDATGDGSVSNPYLTIGKAYNMASSNGDTILVKPGYYEEDLTIAKDNLVIKGVTPDSVRWTATTAVNANNITIEGFLFKSIHTGYAFSSSFHIRNYGENTIIQNNVFFLAQYICSIYTTAPSLIKNNIFIVPISTSNTRTISGIGSGITIENNTLIGDNRGNDYPRPTAIYAIQPQFNIKNNIIADYWTGVIFSNGGIINNDYEINLSNNDLFNVNSYYSGFSPGSTGDIYTDPMLIGKFHLDALSPAIGGGEGGVDIGAVPFNSSLSPKFNVTSHIISFLGEYTFDDRLTGITIGEPEKQNFFIENISSSQLTINSITVEDSDVFEIVSPITFPHTLYPDGSVEVKIKFSPTEIRDGKEDFFDGIIKVVTDDPN
ncbi:hypothetical protein ACFL6O_06695, partial [candidate division KSB1 bacterium]